MIMKIKHGMWHHSAFRTWQSMMDRCFNPRCKDFASYGGRGITVCDAWRNPVIFCAYVGEKPRGKSLGRIRNEEGYAPGNVEWQTALEQGASKRNNRVPGGLAAMARAHGMSESTLRRRLDAGLPYEQAVKTEVRRYEPCGVASAARVHGISARTLRRRLNAGFTVDQAVKMKVRPHRVQS
jgi:AraC-like DNA-binding protein